MHLTYNGIDLNIVRVLENSRTPEYDPTGQDYLWTRHRFAVEAIYSPQVAQSYTGAEWGYVKAGSNAPIPAGGTAPTPAPDPIFPNQSTTRSAPMTDVALRHRLMQPKGKLKCEFDSALTGITPTEVYLESPGLDVTGTPRVCDACNGPLPQECTVTPLGNGRTFLVRYVIETCMSDCRPDSGNPAIISNRWTATLAYDDAYYATRLITGLVIFRADVIRTRGIRPDDLRLSILPPVPGNCKRFIDELTESPDGFSYRYTVRDVEQEYTYLDTPINVDGSPVAGARTRHIASIQAVVNRRFGQSGSKTMFDEIMSSLVNVAFAGQALEGLVGGGGGGGLSDALEGGAGKMPKGGGGLGGKAGPLSLVTKIVGLSVKAGAAFVAAANAVLPEYSETVTVEVRGTRLATRASLQSTAFAVAFGQLTNITGVTIPFSDLASQIGIGLGAGSLPTASYDAIRLASGAAIGGFTSVLPPASVYELEYDLHQRRVRVTINQSYSGLVDWMTGRTAGGWKAITAPLADSAKGGDWPYSAKYNAVVGAGTISPVLPKFPEKDTVIFTGGNGPGYGPPIYTKDGYLSATMGTNLTNIVAASLLGECNTPARYNADNPTPQPTNTELNGPWHYPPN